MREYGSVSPQFWIGKTGKQLRGKPEAQVLALYLMTCPHANMIGVFHCPVMYMAHETGLPLEGASKALASLVEIGFCLYDSDSETVFVVRMAAHQVGEALDSKDNKVKGVHKEVAKIAVPALKEAFIKAYSSDYHLKTEAPSKPLPSHQSPPSKQLTGTGQEQDIDAPQSGANNRRGTRLPQDWVLPKEWELWSVRECGWSQTTVTREADKFRDFWAAKVGKDAAKLDWEATWRNWCRNSRQPADKAPDNVGVFV